MQYDVLASNELETLIGLVNLHLEAGWRLHGDTQCWAGLYRQAMVKG